MTLDRAALDSYLERCRAARLAAGLPERIEDPEVLERIARIVAGGISERDRRAAKTKAAGAEHPPAPGAFTDAAARSRRRGGGRRERS